MGGALLFAGRRGDKSAHYIWCLSPWPVPVDNNDERRWSEQSGRHGSAC